MGVRSLTAHATLSSKGQLVIPKVLREALGLHAGAEVVLTTETDGTLNLSPLRVPVDHLFGMLHQAGRPTVDVDAAILESIRELGELPL
jgi:AbrB family looped-hinge helix DNA binding protein